MDPLVTGQFTDWLANTGATNPTGVVAAGLGATADVESGIGDAASAVGNAVSNAGSSFLSGLQPWLIAIFALIALVAIASIVHDA